MNLNGLPPQGGKEDARPGPEVPYVVARLLNSHPTRVAVISTVAMFNGYTAYPIAYFSQEEPLNFNAFNASWGRETYDVPGGWTDKVDDVFDYDLLPWVERGKIKWIEPGDETHTLSQSQRFPYANLPGRRKSMIIWDNKVLP
ncbi:MAG: hypothetical protein HC877_24410 [Thioploca sp.]|nr:hypothetical protein [Thioploca sp.]